MPASKGIYRGGDEECKESFILDFGIMEESTAATRVTNSLKRTSKNSQ
jgi:hypothetical protein